MIDFECAKYDNAQKAINDVYHILVEITEGYLDRVQQNALDDAFIAELAKKQMQAESILKFNMLIIPQNVFDPLYHYSDKTVKPMLAANWQEKLKENYAFYLERNLLKEPEGKEWTHLSAYCEHVQKYFYESMCRICRYAFGTELLKDSAWGQIIGFFTGKAKNGTD